jgi:hypothetical protein
LIILPCNTFSTLDETERMACLGCVRRHLLPGGIFAASLPNPEWLKRIRSGHSTELEEALIHPQTNNPVQVSSTWQRRKNVFTVSWIYDQLFPDGTVEHLVIKTDHKIASVDEYTQDFEGAGLTVVATYGDFDRSAYTAESPNLIILAALQHY